MRQYSRLTAIVAVAITMCMFVLQSCGSSSSKYGCPERIHSAR